MASFTGPASQREPFSNAMRWVKSGVETMNRLSPAAGATAKCTVPPASSASVTA
ncbi:hypothetical protein NX02_04150 [Sphingomonas sanxanigenens DSM 19645 = NX02]|uniref:Uncharacterized protein n=1 Tax=Sphingomonas sanxanigenens DSM 19645 = NX02 TaxID=1123269 RepID=W0AA97_9SPHN|nr:hypothetical protein NX02_04150 [Sphingomonas sanxanigenens DSM 19645 = NX02]